MRSFYRHFTKNLNNSGFFINPERRLHQLEASNANLASENDLLRAEVSRLKALLAEHQDCDVTRRAGQEEAVR